MNVKLVVIAFLFLLQGFLALYGMAEATRGNHISIRIDSIALLIGLGLLLRLRIAQIAGTFMAACFIVLSMVGITASFSTSSFVMLAVCITVIFGLYSRDVRDDLR